MAYKILIAKEAQEDIDEAIQWYQEQQDGLGIRFYFEVLKQLEKLENTPEHYSFIHNKYRHLVLDSFPFHIIFLIKETSQVLVLAVFHTSKDPQRFINRMK